MNPLCHRPTLGNLILREHIKIQSLELANYDRIVNCPSIRKCLQTLMPRESNARKKEEAEDIADDIVRGRF